MQSVQRGFSFIKQAWQMVRTDPDLIKPSIFTLLAGLGVSVIGFAFIALAVVLWGDSPVGQILTGLFGVVLLFTQLAIGYIFSAMTVYLVYGYLAEGDGRMDRAWAIVRRDWLDLLSLAGASTLVSLFKRAIQGKRNSVLRSMLGDAVSTVWSEATFLILPAMVIEDLNLKDGVLRAAGIIRDNLLLVGVSLVGVRLVNGIIGFVLGAGGVVLGFFVGYGLVAASSGATWGIIGGVGLGVLIAATLVLIAIVLTNYTNTAYHTCLFLWARDEEKAVAAGTMIHATAPAPLAAILP